jgi:hypothetical protein
MAAKGLLFTIRGRNDAAAAVNSFNSGLDRVRSTTSKMIPTQSGFNKGLSENRRAIQQVGFQLSDFAIQIAGGQNAMLAFTQQGGQVLQFFGPFGAIAGALLAIFGSLAIAFVKTGQSLTAMIPAFGQVSGEIQWLVTAFGRVFEVAKQGFEILLSNLDVVVIAISLLAGQVMGAWIISTFTVTGALVALRAVLVTLLPYALILGVAILIERFMRLIEVTGGWAQALQRLSAFASEVFRSMSESANGMYYYVEGVARSIQVAFLSAFSGVVDAWNAAMGAITSGYNQFASVVGADLISWTAGQFDAAGAIASQTREAARSMDASAMWFEDSVATISGAWGSLTAGMGENPFKFDFGGAGAGEGGTGGTGGATGGGSPADAIAEEARRIKEIFEDISSSISKSLLTGFKAVLNGTSNLKTFALDALNSILDKAQDLLLSPIFDMIGGYVANSMVGLFGAPVYPSPSFAGGGHTGNAARSGGLDGKGGFSAILHPRERVVDETMASGSSAGASSLGTVTLLVSESSSFMSTIEATSDKVAVKRISEYDRTTLPGSVQRVNSNGRVR